MTLADARYNTHYINTHIHTKENTAENVFLPPYSSFSIYSVKIYQERNIDSEIEERQGKHSDRTRRRYRFRRNN